MARYRNRRPQLLDLIPRFESQSSAMHSRDARATIERLRDDRMGFCQSGSEQDRRWLDACNTLLDSLAGTRGRRDVDGQDLATAMREFVQEFEHSTLRIDQILHSAYALRTGAPDKEVVYDWLDVAYRLSTYALLSAWIDDKTENRTATIQFDLESGDITEEWCFEPMKIPRRYRRAADKL